jgi:hypothetical protein
MSDRTNRDRGRKKATKRGKWVCDCWLCISGKEKKHRIMEKSTRQDRKEIRRELGYARIGANNV